MHRPGREAPGDMKRSPLTLVPAIALFYSSALASDDVPRYKLAMFGDSITVSYAAQAGEKITDHVQTILGERSGQSVEWTVVNEGVGRETARKALRRIRGVLSRENPDFVSIAYGLVDCNKKDAAGFKEDVERLLDVITSQDSKIRVILITTIPVEASLTVWSRDPYFKGYGGANRYLRNEINGVLRSVAREKRLAFIDLFRYLAMRRDWKDSLKKDGIHPDAAGNKIIGEYLGNALFSYFSARLLCDPAALRKEDEARLLLRKAFERFWQSRGKDVKACADLEDRAWNLCSYLSEISAVFSLSSPERADLSFSPE